MVSFRVKVLLVLALQLIKSMASLPVTTKVPVNAQQPFSSIKAPRLAHYANVAYGFFRNISCEQTFFTPKSECHKLRATPPSSMNLHFAKPTKVAKYRALLPNGDLFKFGSHDAVLVIDPFPAHSPGHLVMIFFVDFQTNQFQCERKSGIYLGDEECLSLGLKKRCYNSLNQLKFWRRCETKFLPIVYLDNNDKVFHNLLGCVDHVKGFAPCPGHVAETQVNCDPLQTNTHRCQRNRSTSQRNPANI